MVVEALKDGAEGLRDSTLEKDIASNFYQVLGLDPDATFSEIKNSYQTLSSQKLHMETEKSESSPHPNVFLRLLTEFLRDPDIKAQWAVTATHHGIDISVVNKSIDNRDYSLSLPDRQRRFDSVTAPGNLVVGDTFATTNKNDRL
jgi:hypothetical protein